MNLQKIKQHMRVTYNFDDDLIQDYMDWAEEEIKNTVSSSDTREEEFFVDNATYDRAVAFLVTHFYENRKSTTEKPQYNLIFGAKSAIMKLKIQYAQKFGDLDGSSRDDGED
ncbi:head-tail connector protein [Macrococcoides caseolyticum]|uniref:head-tail connector protein n=1 Tax=Macrococcoides caseolyticum TaxID=69966 RepID=UPI0018E16E43|nr:head-tail connector protein [Macrococcus caseolyticus]QQB05859.1 phage gp6-like head-tail connector protein [Macrococcus caseolyticus]